MISKDFPLWDYCGYWALSWHTRGISIFVFPLLHLDPAQSADVMPTGGRCWRRWAGPVGAEFWSRGLKQLICLSGFSQSVTIFPFCGTLCKKPCASRIGVIFFFFPVEYVTPLSLYLEFIALESHLSRVVWGLVRRDLISYPVPSMNDDGDSCLQALVAGL